MVTMRRGMVGSSVRDLQIALNAYGRAGLKVDGIFGPKTEAAVRAFQEIFNLTIDGIVGKETATALVGACVFADRIDHVHAMARGRQYLSRARSRYRVRW